MAGGIVITACAAALVAILAGPGEVRLPDRAVRVGDVAHVRGPEAIGKIVIAKLPDSRSETISRERLAQLLQRAIPAIAIQGAVSGTISLVPAIKQKAADVSQPVAAHYVPRPAIIRRGDKLRLVSRAGPVTITREVTAVQAAHRDQPRLFVRTADGMVFSAPLEEREGR